jgi:predicted CopG family antitoxin
MATTIQIRRDTLEKLKALKEEKKIPNYDGVIEYLIKKEREIPDSLFGFMKGKITPYSKEDEDSDHDL